MRFLAKHVYSRALEGSKKFPPAFGTFPYSDSIKQRVLSLFYKFGLREGYKVVPKYFETVAELAKKKYSLSRSKDVD